MQDIKRELRDRGKWSIANTRIYFEVQDTALRLHLHTKGFQLSIKDLQKRDIHRGITTYNTEVHNSNSLTHLYKRGRHKPKHKAKERLQLCDPIITNST